MFASMDPSIDYYKILGIAQNASKADVRSAYLKLAKIWHPDLHRDEKAKLKARAKFIEIGAAYEILHDDGQRKKYDDYRKYGHTQQLPYEHKSNPFNHGSAPFSQSEWEKAFRGSMDNEWERIRREQTAWARSRGKDYQRSYNYPQNEDPFESFRNQRPWDAHFQPHLKQITPMDRMIRMLFSLFMFILLFRAVTILLFGGHRRKYDDWRNNGGRHPPPSPYSPYSNPNEPYNKDNIRDKRRLPYDSYSDADRKLQRNQRRSSSAYPPSNRTSLRSNHDQNGSDEDIDMTFSAPSVQQTRESKLRNKAYNQQLVEQNFIRDLYSRAQTKQKEEIRRKNEFDEKFHGKRKRREKFVVVENENGRDERDVNDDWVKYINNNSRSNRNSTNWRDD